MDTVLPGIGAFGFGIVIGWFVYFTNRYRKGDVQFSDLATLLGIIGGGAVTALFGEGKATLFGAYGLGLAVGFFAYFVMLLVLVKASNGVFTWTWFLDGRRKMLKDDEEIGTEPRPALVPPRAMQPSQPPAAIAMAQPARSLLPQYSEQRNRAIEALTTAIRDLSDRAGATGDAGIRAQLRQSEEELSRKLNMLVAARLIDILESDQTKAALLRLQGITDELNLEARHMRDATDAIAQTAIVIDRVTQVVAFLAAIFP